MKEMYAIAEREGINIRWWDFAPPLRGLYWAPKDLPPVIALDNALENNTPLLRSIFAEELGHHFTLDRAAICRTYFNYRDRLAVSRAEYRAWKWAAEYLIPKKQLRKALRNGNGTLWDLAELFDVTEEMMEFRLKLA